MPATKQSIRLSFLVADRCLCGWPSQLPATKMTLFVLCKTKSKRDPPCQVMHTPPAIVLRDYAGNTRVVPGVSDEPWWTMLTSVSGLKTLRLGLSKQLKQLIAVLHFPSAADLRSMAPTADGFKTFVKRVTAGAKDFAASVGQLQLPTGAARLCCSLLCIRIVPHHLRKHSLSLLGHRAE